MAIKNRETGAVTYVGFVLETGLWQCDRVMSDIYADQCYALVWDTEKNEPRKVLTGSTFELCRISYEAKVDATPEVLAAYGAFQAHKEAVRQERDRKMGLLLLQEEHNTPRLGKRMVVTRNWKTVRKGTEGEVFWVRGGRVGIRTSDRKENGKWSDVIWCQASQLRNAECFPSDLS